MPRALALVLAVSSVAQLVNRPATFANALDQYSRGQYEAAVDEALHSAPRLADFRQMLQRDGREWVSREGPAAEPRRRLVVATLVIDIARHVYTRILTRASAEPNQRTSSVGEVETAWRDLRSLVEWACALVRQQESPSPLEREWFLASLQLFRDFGDTDVRPLPSAAGYQFRSYEPAPGHLGHALRRFPDEPWIQLLIVERLTGQVSSWVRVRHALPQTRPSRETRGFHESLPGLRHARAKLLPLVQAPTVRARVHLNLGGIALSLGERQAARQHFEDIEPWTSNRCLVYLGRFLTARVDELDERLVEAEHGYRSALEVVPRAQSGTIALSTLLWLDRRQADATRFVEEAFSGPSVADDPWTAWQNFGHCTEWQGFIARLRGGLQQR